jgi:hypothetical protein
VLLQKITSNETIRGKNKTMQKKHLISSVEREIERAGH